MKFFSNNMEHCVTYSPLITPSLNAFLQIWPWSCFKAVVFRSEFICQMTLATTASMMVSLLKIKQTKWLHCTWLKLVHHNYNLWNNNQLQFYQKIHRVIEKLKFKWSRPVGIYMLLWSLRLRGCKCLWQRDGQYWMFDCAIILYLKYRQIK